MTAKSKAERHRLIGTLKSVGIDADANPDFVDGLIDYGINHVIDVHGDEDDGEKVIEAFRRMASAIRLEYAEGLSHGDADALIDTFRYLVCNFDGDECHKADGGLTGGEAIRLAFAVGPTGKERLN